MSNTKKTIELTNLGKRIYQETLSEGNRISSKESQFLSLLKDSFTQEELKNMVVDAEILIHSFEKRGWIYYKDLSSNNNKLNDIPNSNLNDKSKNNFNGSEQILNDKKNDYPKPSQEEIHNSLVDFLKLFEN